MSVWAGLWTLGFAATLCAQGVDRIRDYPGRPPSAPLVTFLGLVGHAKIATDPSIAPKGPVARVVWQEFQVRGEAQPTLWETSTIEYDERGREATRVEKQNPTESETVTKYQGERIAAETSAFKRNGAPSSPQEWNYWTYDAAGHLTDFRRGRGDKLENHYTNFKYDLQGRLISMEYHEGADDALWSREEYAYVDDAKRVDQAAFKDNQRFHWQSLTLDDQGRVVRAEIHDIDPITQREEPPTTLSFAYDSKGRVIEQVADVARAKAESLLQPGKIHVIYDDVKHTEETSGTDGKDAIKFTTLFDEAGAVVGSTTVLNGRVTSHDELECTYDSHGNWIECKRWVSHDGRHEMNRLWHRTITYR